MDWIPQPRERISTLTAPERRLHLSAGPRCSLHTSVIPQTSRSLLRQRSQVHRLNQSYDTTRQNKRLHFQLINYKVPPTVSESLLSCFEQVNRVCWCYTVTIWIGEVLCIYKYGNVWPLVLLLILQYACMNHFLCNVKR